jgi:DNA repair exonuclease SbcCD ATPase subunit
MAVLRCVVFAALFTAGFCQPGEIVEEAAGGPTPISKVITLVHQLRTEVEEESQLEGSTYNKFACFCKETTKKKSDSVIEGKEHIDILSANIAEKTQTKKNKKRELGERKKKQEELMQNLEETKTRCAKEKGIYDATNADLSKAISSLEAAITALEESKPEPEALIQMKAAVEKLASAGVSETATTARKVVSSLLQQKVDPEDPEYEFHSHDIISVCESLLRDFRKEKQEVDAEWAKTAKACKETIASLTKEMAANKKAMEELTELIDQLSKEIAEHREDLVEAQSQMKDDEQYLKDLTNRCEDRANDYDQRSKMRGDEIEALTQAENILEGKVATESEVNKRAAFLQTRLAEIDAEKKGKAPSFLQTVKAHNILAKGRADNSLEQEARKNAAIDMLRGEARRIGSMTIAALTTRIPKDPFAKVTHLIQQLIERLLEEAKAEATKKGFCDEAVGSAEQERKFRYEAANDLSREIEALESKDDKLSTSIKKLNKDVKDETRQIREATKERKEEKESNMETIKTAKEGLKGVLEATAVLKNFYSQAAKAAAFVQASPVDEDTDGAGFEGSYKGKQGGVKAIFGLLEVLASDFERTIRKTEEAEEKSHRDFVEFDQTGKSSVAGKSTGKDLDQQDLKTVKTTIKKKYADLQSQQDLLDESLKELEALKPQCIDTGMTYAERVAKRDQEIAALKQAYKMLLPPKGAMLD